LKIGSMTDADDRRFVAAFTQALEADKGDEAKRHLAAGRPIYCGDARFNDAVVKKYPDGRCELVRFKDGEEFFVRAL
jgi:hypothetical protein